MNFNYGKLAMGKSEDTNISTHDFKLDKREFVR